MSNCCELLRHAEICMSVRVLTAIAHLEFSTERNAHVRCKNVEEI